MEIKSIRTLKLFAVILMPLMIFSSCSLMRTPDTVADSLSVSANVNILSLSSYSGVSMANANNNIKALTIDEALSDGYSVELSGYDTLSGSYYIDKVDKFIDTLSNGKSGEVYILTFEWINGIPQQTNMYYINTNGQHTYLYSYKNNGGTLTYDKPILINKLIKSPSNSGNVYKTQGNTSDASVELITAANVVAPATAKDCVLQYEQSQQMRNGVKTFYLESKKLRKPFDWWITGVSSPSIKSYDVSDVAENGDTFKVNGSLTWTHSGSPDIIEKHVYTVINEDGYFRIDSDKVIQ